MKIFSFNLSFCSMILLAPLLLFHTSVLYAKDFGDVVIIGDSITQARGGTYGYRYNLWKKLIDGGHTFDYVGSHTQNYDYDTSYPAYNGHVFDRDNEGHWGWKTLDILVNTTKNNTSGSGNLQQWLGGYTPDTALILIGANDVKYSTGYSAADTDNFIGIIISLLKTDNPNVKIYLGSMIPSRTDWANQAVFQQLNALLLQRADNDAAIDYVDLWTGMSASEHLYDGIHPNPAGEEIMGQKFYDAMTIPEPTTALIVSIGVILFCKKQNKLQ